MYNLESLSPKLAFLEDDLDFTIPVIRDLQKIGCKVSHFQTGEDCLKSLQNTNYDICLFDLNLPGISGLEVMIRLKIMNRMPPVIFMTSHDTEEDVAHVLTAGADDYVIKPLSLNVLRARIQALLRRVTPKVRIPQNEQLGHLVIDYFNKQIFANGYPVSLTGKESTLAFTLFERRGQIILRQDLQKILDIHDQAFETRRLDVHISRLRSKLALNITNGWKLSSIYQRGYRLEFFSGV